MEGDAIIQNRPTLSMNLAKVLVQMAQVWTLVHFMLILRLHLTRKRRWGA
jgi:hypothetical protein